jgi:hypothetical protein
MHDKKNSVKKTSQFTTHITPWKLFGYQEPAGIEDESYHSDDNFPIIRFDNDGKQLFIRKFIEKTFQLKKNI